MKVYALLNISYDWTELIGIFKNYWTARNYLFAMIINKSRINISDSSIQERLQHYEIEEHEML